MGWHDDDFPDEDTNPGMEQPRHVPQQVPQQNARPGYQQPSPTGGYPQQQGPNPTGGYPQQPGPNRTGGYPQQQGPNPQQQQRQPGPNRTGGHPQQGGPNATPSGGFPQQPGYGPNTGGFPQQTGPPPASPSQVQKLAAPVVAVEEDAKASRVVYGLSGTALGGVTGVILGVFNTKIEGLTITQGTDFIFMCAIWFAFFTGLMCFLFPDRFAYAIMKWTDPKEPEEPLPPPQ